MTNAARLAGLFFALLSFFATAPLTVAQELDSGDPKLATYKLPKLAVGPRDWPEWGGTSIRNSAPAGRDVPTDWDVATGRNIKWSARLGSQSYGAPVVANGRIYIGTNNGAGYLKRFPNSVDLGCLLCFEERNGKFLWQYSAQKLPTGRVHDWPLQGIVSTPVVDGERLWIVNNRGEVVCLDALGFPDGENDGARGEDAVADDEADVVWTFDMMKQLGISQHNMCTCSMTCAGDALFVVTGNGVDEGHRDLPKPDAPAFVALDRRTGAVLWTDRDHGKNVLHGSWSSPTYAVLGGRPQVLFPGGDCWLYSFDPAGDGKGNSKLLWKFDCNPKSARYVLGGRGRRNEYITTPVVWNGRVYVATGQDSEHGGEGGADLWCLDPAKRLDGSDVSAELVTGSPDGMPREFVRGGAPADRIVPNPRSAVVWRYNGQDLDGDGKLALEETMSRTLAHVSICAGLLFAADFCGTVHCLDAETGKAHWTHDMFATCWLGPPLIVDGKVYVCDEDGDVTIFKLAKEKSIVAEINMQNAMYTGPIVANGVFYIANKSVLYAIANDAQSEPLKSPNVDDQ